MPRLAVLAVTVLAMAGQAHSRPLSTIGIRGEWHVVKSDYIDRSGVQAYADAELRASVGGRLLINRASARWVLSPKSKRALAAQDAFNKPCLRPTVKALGDDQYELLCQGNDSFSPGMTMMMDGTLVLMMDGAEFYLRKGR